MAKLEENKKIAKKYEKLLNNLLDIKGRDQTVFTRVNGFDTFSIVNKFGRPFAEKVLSQNDFTLTLEEKDLGMLYEIVSREKNPKKIIQSFERFQIRLISSKAKRLMNPKLFNVVKKEILEDLGEKIEKSNAR